MEEEIGIGGAVAPSPYPDLATPPVQVQPLSAGALFVCSSRGNPAWYILCPMATGIPELRGEAKRAVLQRGSHLQILAGAGTGKTEVMRQRVVSLLAEGLPPESIVAGAFNIDAGEELKRRVEEGVKAHPKLGPDFLGRTNNCSIGTLHSYLR